MAAISLSSFVDALRQHRLLEPAQLEALQARHTEPKALAGELIRRDWLTPFQANLLLQGRGAELMRGSYLLLERLGEGGMGEVFKARHRNLRRVAAVKLIRKERLQSPDAVRRFVREVRAAAALAHPNIVRAYDADEIDGTHLLAMEYIDGAIDLARLVKERGPLPVAQACAFVRQAALGLQHAFERGMVHRDIKPHNLLLTGDGVTVKVLDMGLARLDDSEGEASTTVTREGSVMGTPDYIAPEQAMDSHTVDIRADIYSLGCTLYFLLTGQPPFPGGGMMEKLLKHRLDEPTALERLRLDVPPAVTEVVRRMMAKKAADRYQNPAEVAAALEEPVPIAPRPAPADAISADSATAIVADASPGASSGEQGLIFRPSSARPEAPWPRWLVPASASGVVVVVAVLGLLSYASRTPAPKVDPLGDDIVVTLPPRPRPPAPSVEPPPEPAKPAVELSELPPELLVGDAWGRFPPGSWTRRRTKTVIKGTTHEGELKVQLKSIAGGKVKVEQSATGLKKPIVLDLDSNYIVDLFVTLTEWKRFTGKVERLREEDLKIAGRLVRTQVIVISVDTGGIRSHAQLWIARDVPGAVCRSIQEGGNIRSEAELVEFEIASSEAKAAAGSDFADRAAATTLQPQVGYVRLRIHATGQVANIPRDQPLPREPFWLIGVGFDKEKLPADFVARVLLPAVGGLGRFGEIHDPNECLTLSPDDLTRLAGTPTAGAITTLSAGINLSAASLDALKKLPNLVRLRASAAEVDDALLGRLGELPKVKDLGLRRLGASGKVTLGKGLMALAKLQLGAVSFRESTLMPLEIVAFVAGAAVATLEKADLADVPVQDGHLTILAMAKRLTEIGLDRTRVTDAGLVQLAKLKTLKAVSLVGTKVSEAGVQMLSAGLPGCRIVWDRGVVQAPARVNSRPALQEKKR